jgi:hypothetical protein
MVMAVEFGRDGIRGTPAFTGGRGLKHLSVKFRGQYIALSQASILQLIKNSIEIDQALCYETTYSLRDGNGDGTGDHQVQEGAGRPDYRGGYLASFRAASWQFASL